MKLQLLHLLAAYPLIVHSSSSTTYLPLSYTIPSSTTECLYERITNIHEHITSSIFLLSGQELTAAYIFEGPVAPVDISSSSNISGQELQKYITIYNQQGTKMFVNGRYGDSMVNVVPIQISGIVDMEMEVEEDYIDDTVEEMERMHDMERQQQKRQRHHGQEEVGEEGLRYQEMKHDMEEMKKEHPDMDDYAIAHEERLKMQMEEEAMADDDFVKLQLDHDAHRNTKNNNAQRDSDGGGGGRMEDTNSVNQHGRRLQENGEDENEQQHQQYEHHHHDGRRRLKEVEHMVPGEPFQKTVMVESPGWYRLCVTAKWGDIEVEMELRKSSTYGPIDKHTGHVPGSDAALTHSEIHHLYEKEDDATVLAEEEAIKTEDLTTTKEQLRILEKVYQDIITKQLEERRVWNWRTVKNQHLYSHLVLGNLVETVVYCVISGYQVYTIRKWFGGGPSLGR
ncbi:hypothetical protein ACHAXM_004506 [Skeletonema potamos]